MKNYHRKVEVESLHYNSEAEIYEMFARLVKENFFFTKINI